MTKSRLLSIPKTTACLMGCLLYAQFCIGQVKSIPIGKTQSLYSEILDESRELLIYTPEPYHTETRSYPILYLMDAEWHFHFVSGIIKQLSSNGDIPEMIVVGVVNTNRNRDLTPAGPNDNPQRYGGAAKFLDFLITEVQPFVESNYRVQPYQMIYGHSFGGLFAIYAMLNRPDFFESYISLSPSLGRNNQQQVTAASTFIKDHQNLSSSLYLAVGNEGGGTFIGATNFSAILESHPSNQFRWTFQHLPNEDHGSITVRGLLEGLAFIFDGFNVERKPELDEIFLVEAHYQELSDQLGFELKVPEHSYQKFTQQQIGARDLDYALFILEKYQQQYPDSPELMLMFADVWLLKGDFTNAKRYYEKLVDLGIQDERVKQLLKRL